MARDLIYIMYGSLKTFPPTCPCFCQSCSKGHRKYAIVHYWPLSTRSSPTRKRPDRSTCDCSIVSLSNHHPQTVL